MDKLEITKVVEYCRNVLCLDNERLSDEYFYQSLPLCVIDAVYSLRARYESTRLVVIRYCNYFKLQRIRENREVVTPIETQESIDEFLEKMNKLGIERFTNEIFDNRQRTSTQSGIPKTEAVFRFASVLKEYRINYLQDVPKVISDVNFEREIDCIPGQNRETSLNYFFMLSGSDDFVKADRHILNFLKNATLKQVTPQEAKPILVEVVNLLRLEYPQLTPRLLDHVIWNYQRDITK